MLIILEGVNGVGKTTLAASLAKVGYTRLKPFRVSDKGHWGDQDTEVLRGRLIAMGIPVNSYVEDIFIAEFLRQLPSLDVVLDRSIPTSLAYSTLPQGVDPSELLALWTSLLAPLRPLYINMVASYRVAAERSGTRALPFPEYCRVIDAFDKIKSDLSSDWQTLSIDTTFATPDEVWQQVLKDEQEIGK